MESILRRAIIRYSKNDHKSFCKANSGNIQTLYLGRFAFVAHYETHVQGRSVLAVV